MSIDERSPETVLALFAGATVLLLVGGFLVWRETGLHSTLSAVLIASSLGILAVGYFVDRGRLPGWVLMATYWSLQPMHLFYRDTADYVNASFAALAVPFFLYLAYRELVESDGVLRFAAGMSVVAGGGYFSLYYFPVLGDQLRYVVAWISHGVVVTLTGDEITLVERASPGAADYMPIIIYDELRLGIILACTGIQSILIFASGILVTSADRVSKGKALMATAPVIFGLNLVRVSGEAWGIHYLMGQGWTELAAYNLLENGVAKVASLIALFVLAYVTFVILPSLQEDISDLLALPRSDGPLERVLGLSRKAEE